MRVCLSLSGVSVQEVKLWKKAAESRGNPKQEDDEDVALPSLPPSLPPSSFPPSLSHHFPLSLSFPPSHPPSPLTLKPRSWLFLSPLPLSPSPSLAEGVLVQRDDGSVEEEMKREGEGKGCEWWG